MKKKIRKIDRLYVWKKLQVSRIKYLLYCNVVRCFVKKSVKTLIVLFIKHVVNLSIILWRHWVFSILNTALNQNNESMPQQKEQSCLRCLWFLPSFRLKKIFFLLSTTFFFIIPYKIPCLLVLRLCLLLLKPTYEF